MRRILALAAVLALSACGSSSARPSTPKAWRASIVAGALAQHSFHWTYSSFFDLIGPRKRVGDVQAGSAVEWDTLGPGETAEIRLVHDTVYVRGNNAAIDSLGLTPWRYPSSQIYRIGSSRWAHRYAGRWISIPKGDKLYSGFLAYLTPASILRLATPRGMLREKLHRRLRDVDGTVGRGFGAQAYELKARASGTPLPVSYRWRDMTVDSVDMHFGKWNEPVAIEAPKNAVPIATVRRS